MATRIREKAKLRRENADVRPRASAKHIRMSPYKVRIVLDIIRGKAVNEAIAILEHTPQSASCPILKVLNSAVANAENNSGLSRLDLKVAECFAGQGPTLKRMQPRAKGRGYSIFKRTSHITIVLDNA
jgi:large subunit ribosomal protein L22